MSKPEYFIHVKPDSFYVNSSNNLVGIVYHSVGDSAFPGKNWTDFVAFVLIESLNAIIRIQQRESKSEDILFMDGPYRIRISSAGHSRLCVEFVADRNGSSEIEFEYVISEQDYRSAVLTATESVLTKCAELDWRSADVDQLMSLHALVSAST